MKPGSEWRIQVVVVGFFTAVVLFIVGYKLLKGPHPQVKPLPVSATVELPITASPVLIAPRPVLDDCPSGIEVSFRRIGGKLIVEMLLDELESQIHTKMLCHIGNQLRLADYAERRK